MGMEQGLRPQKVTDKFRNVEMLLLLSAPLPGAPWGVLEVLRPTVWGQFIPQVTSEAYEEAQRGDVGKLCKVLRNPPKSLAKRNLLPCKFLQDRTCFIRSEQKCVPGNGKLPFCYQAPAFGPESSPEVEEALTHVMRAWDEGRHVFVLLNPVG